MQSLQYSECVCILVKKNKLKKIFKHISHVGVLRWVAYENLVYQIFFLQ